MPFEFASTDIPGVILVRPRVFLDPRGSFVETFKRSDFAAHDIALEPIQINESFSSAGVVRGMHYQLEPYAQGKLVRILHGRAVDVAVDIREGSPWFGRHVRAELSGQGGEMLWIPPGFAHGFCALEDTHLLYLQSAEYAPDAEQGIHPLDTALGIDWPTSHEPLLSDKDARLPGLSDCTANFTYVP